jgi:hypothetical protein
MSDLLLVQVEQEEETKEDENKVEEVEEKPDEENKEVDEEKKGDENGEEVKDEEMVRINTSRIKNNCDLHSITQVVSKLHATALGKLCGLNRPLNSYDRTK